MRGTRTTSVIASLLVLAALLSVTGHIRAQDEGGQGEGPQDEEVNNDYIQMIVDLLNDSTPEMRALGLEQIREEEAVKGAAATKKFVALLPNLTPDRQAELLAALGDRQDPTAKPGVLDMLENTEPSVRAAALRALGALGDADDVATLVASTMSKSSLEKQAAAESLLRLRGDDVNGAILDEMASAAPDAQVALLGALAGRDAKETVGAVLDSAKSPEPSVRVAAFGALRYLAQAKDVESLIEVLKPAEAADEKYAAELALLALCGREGDACGQGIVAAMADAAPAARAILVRALARVGGEDALAEIIGRLDDENSAVCTEAVRMLSIWPAPEPPATDALLQLAGQQESLKHRVLAIRGLVRLATPVADGGPADLELLSKTAALAKRLEEKRLVLGALTRLATPEAITMAADFLQDEMLAEEAGLAVVTIAETASDGDKAPLRAPLNKVLERVENENTRKRAEKIIASL